MEFNGKNIIEIECMEFAEAIVKISRRIAKEHKEFNMTDQLLRSGTAVGALYGESHYAESDADDVHKLKIALKECHESQYWLELLFKTKFMEEKECEVLYEQANKIHRLMNSCVKTVMERKGK